MKAVLIGAGPMALEYAKVLRALDMPFEVVGRGARSAASFADATGVRPFEGGLASYLAGRALDGGSPVIVALPVTDLADATKRLIAAGARRVLVEKPAGLTPAEVDGVAKAATDAKANVYVAYNRRFFASVAAARAMIATDGGVSSFHVEFTERVDQVATPGKAPALLGNWLLANSSHVLDLAFHLGGEPVEASGEAAGCLPWHPAGAVFAGHGRTARGALFTWHADWSSAGRWGLDLRTPQRRLLLQPLECLQVQEKGSFAMQDIALDDRLDRDHKPGIVRQLQAFFSAEASRTALPSIEEHASMTGRWLPAILARRTAIQSGASSSSAGGRA